MKKIFLIALVTFAAFSAKSQIVPMITPNYLAIDTVTNSAAEGPHVTVLGYQKVLTLQVNTTVISGTFAGKIYWQGSFDSIPTHYVTFDSSTLQNASVSYAKKEIEKGFVYYRALISPTGTSSVSYYGTAYYTKPLNN